MNKIEYRYSIASVYTGAVVKWKEFKTIQEADAYRQQRGDQSSWKLVRRPILEWEDVPENILKEELK